MQYIAQINILFAIGIHISATAALPMPQYGMQGMGGGGGYGYGYPMGGGMMGNNGPMMGNGSQMGGPYGAYGNPMYMPGEGSGHYHNGHVRGQRYHAHADVDSWPLPKNPYMNARANRYFANNALYANNGGGGWPTMHAPGHNRVPTNDSNDDADTDKKEDLENDEAGDANSSSKKGDDSADSHDDAEGTHVGGINRISASANSGVMHTSELLWEHSQIADMNTSLDLDKLSSKIINVSDLNRAAATHTTTSSGTTTLTPKTTLNVATKSSATLRARQTITRNLASAKPTSAPKPQKAQVSIKPVVRMPADKHSSISTAHNSQATSSTNLNANTRVAEAHTSSYSGHFAQATKSVSSIAKHEPSMKRIRGL
ncbi:hypothetical protein BX070DRAFT_229275 [Coemansia spiralis]|nr:hypothetical protein BX070DRAFT_229275 [Coemansia spiralis]